MVPKYLCLFCKIQNHLVIRPPQGSERNAMPRSYECPSPICMTVAFMFLIGGAVAGILRRSCAD
jgi:hypothetical protein